MKRHPVLEIPVRWPQVLLVALVACPSCGDAEPRRWTMNIDCVAMLGHLTAGFPMPIEAVSLSGLPRGKRMSDLTQAELAFLSDYSQCVSFGGYIYSVKERPGKEPGSAVEVIREVGVPAVIEPYQGLRVKADHAGNMQLLGDATVGEAEDCIRSNPLAMYTFSGVSETTECIIAMDGEAAARNRGLIP